MVNNNHGTVAQVGNTLVRVAASGDDFYFGAFAGEILVAEGEGEDIKVERVDMLGGSNFR